MERRKTTILIIDDDPDDLELFVEATKVISSTIECITAEGSKMALALLIENNLTPDFIFLDQNMPLMSGKMVLAEIKKIDRLRYVPIIIYSTEFSPEEKSYFHAKGAFTLHKTTAFDDMIIHIAEVIGRAANFVQSNP